MQAEKSDSVSAAARPLRHPHLRTDILGCLLAFPGMLGLLATIWVELHRHSSLFGGPAVSHTVGYVCVAMTVAGLLLVLWPRTKHAK